MGNYKES